MENIEKNELETALDNAVDKALEKFKKENSVVTERKLPEYNSEETKDIKKAFSAFISKAAISTSTSPVLVPAEYSPIIVDSIGLFGAARRNCFVQTLDSNQLIIPRYSASADPSGNWLSEGSSSTATSMDALPVTLPMKAFQVSVQLTKEMLNTAGYDITGIVQSKVGKVISKAEDVQAFTGTGSPFTGVYGDAGVNSVTLSATGSASASTAGLQYADLVAMEAKIDPDFRPNSKFYIDMSEFAYIRNLKDLSNRPLLDVTGGNTTLMGYPIEVLSSGVLNGVSTTASASKHIIFGDMSQVWIAQNQQIEYLVDPYTNASQRLVNFHFTIYEAIGVAQPGALCYLKLA